MRLSKPLQENGYFWLAGKSRRRLPGILRIDERGKATLEVIGVFGNQPTELISRNPILGRIVGVIENGDVVTLDRCFYKAKNVRFGGLSKSTIFAHFVFIGFQYKRDQKITLYKLKFSVEGLDEWLSISGFRVKHNWRKRSVRIHFAPPKEIVHQLQDGIGIAFTFTGTVPGAPNITEAKITQKAYILLTSESPRPIADFLVVMFKIHNFLCFATDKTVSLDSATGFSREVTRDSGNGKKHEVPIKMYYESIPFSEVSPNVQWHEMLFCYGHIAKRLERILNSWLTNYETSEPAFNLYFSSKAGTHEYLEGRFLSLAQGIETLHRRNSKETLLPESNFNHLRDAILKGCPSEKQKWLQQKLEYANELPLRRRLRQMIEPFEKLYGNPSQRKHFIGKVIDTRNYLTHYDVKLFGRAARAEEMWNLCMKLEALFQLHFLRLIGLENEVIINLARENRKLHSKLEINAGAKSNRQE